MLDTKVLSLETPEEALNALAGAQVFFAQSETFVATRNIDNCKVRSSTKKTGPVVIVFEDDTMVWSSEPFTISYDPKGELQ